MVPDSLRPSPAPSRYPSTPCSPCSPYTPCTPSSPCTPCAPSSSLPGQLRIDTSSSSHNVSALVGKRAVLSCTVRNLNNHSVRILLSSGFIRHPMELNFQQNLHFATLALKSDGGRTRKYNLICPLKIFSKAEMSLRGAPI